MAIREKGLRGILEKLGLDKLLKKLKKLKFKNMVKSVSLMPKTQQNLASLKNKVTS